MLNTHKLLYILPDVAYLAELLPGKKPSTFTISSFRQINGEYMDENEFLAENILKLFKKIDPEEYRLILPDFLFTNTIVGVKEKSDAKIKEYLTHKLLPELNLGTNTHQVDTTVLTEHGDTTKIQLSALEKSLIQPLQISAEQTKLKIKSISPLSWSIKSLVSLEPSISVIQIGSMLYVALHYIGVDQASQATVDEVENIFETIKTLKGAEPSIQTIYLLSNELVEEKLKEHLSDTLPIQQLAGTQDENSKIPAYVQKTIEAGMRTLAISDYPVPQFELGKAPAGATIQITKQDGLEKNQDEDETSSSLPKPQKTELNTSPANSKKETAEEKIGAVEVATTSKPEVKLAPIIPTKPDIALEKTPTQNTQEDDEIEALLANLKTDNEVGTSKFADSKNQTTPLQNKKNTPEDQTMPKKDNSPNLTVETLDSQATPPTKKIIKNKNKTKTMLKMIFITLVVFFATVGIGIGIGLGVLQLTKSSTSTTPVSPVVEVSPTPSLSPSPSPSASPAAEINKAEISILVVNATTKAGYAGEIADKLTADEFKTVKASNAKGDYETGNYVLLETQDQALITLLEKTTELSLVFEADKKIEDSRGDYDAVIVLAK